jgi:hypothetical protein
MQLTQHQTRYIVFKQKRLRESIAAIVADAVDALRDM